MSKNVLNKIESLAIRKEICCIIDKDKTIVNKKSSNKKSYIKFLIKRIKKKASLI